MPDDLSSKSGLTRTATFGRDPLASRELGETPHLERRLHVDDDAGRDGLLELRDGFSRAGETDVAASLVGVERHRELACGGDVETVDQPGEMLHDAGHRIRLDRVMQLDRGRQDRSQQRDLARHDGAIVDVERRPAGLGDDVGNPPAADHDLAVLHLEPGQRRVLREDVEAHAVAAEAVANAGGERRPVELAVRIARQLGQPLDAMRHHVSRHACAAMREQPVDTVDRRRRTRAAMLSARCLRRAPGAALPPRPHRPRARRRRRLPRLRSGSRGSPRS